ncbi:hypothetical protein HQ305_16805 [Rhodococcus sp. BP-149]|uniref:DUF6361 family protein n=1 Tax=unclassified Rhodococcus (in: high G+C Gram-positive bacteria) TaxID=192944 RepID=UPI001C9AEA58|nr:MULTISPECIES: DUF6361 family protein [unclassified Rhodococcus (in: high G+C Gram-positive bacteria)]MBY6687221.1 hypothetical protein [Rhodococcus sp. BP-288]MBY6694356.1 hypothetical protein [Rhodococcus sp. BP-188]MBY6698065.1 hypothetical protein [Rhodococcus sp. BP-285]MBY6704285.1 hypothetical protein [Rhodococcus sp. BP-283]MBY6712934.1 hypothetical protein [Rhodococcus sp. BP-160]
MPSSLSWLDTSADEQRRVRELIALYAQSESRDELGIGQIRDAFADGLFPGTSTIHTRARYFLFIPWLFAQGAKTRSGSKLEAWADTHERRLIKALKDEGIGAGQGLIGRVAGAGVKTLPSAIYWAALTRYGILTRDVQPGMLGALRPAPGADDELAVRRTQDWHPTLPPAPEGFPTTVEGGMSLLPEEAVWLRERILEAAPGTMLAHLLLDDTPLDDEDTPPWFDPACLAGDGPLASLLRHGRLFSLVMQGSALLYNLLIAERYEAAGLTTHAQPVDRYREDISDWAESVQADGELLSAWDRQEMWDLVRTTNPRIGLQTRAFVDGWIDAVLAGKGAAVADDSGVRSLVDLRERRQKGAQSRLVNDRLLRTWSGASGTSMLVYRWPQVKRIVADIREGIADAGA